VFHKGDVDEVFPINKSFGTVSYFSNLMKEYKHGVQVQFLDNNNGGKIWSIDLRFDLFGLFGSFDEAGYPIDTSVTDSDNNTTANLMQDVFDFINVLRSEKRESVLKDGFNRYGDAIVFINTIVLLSAVCITMQIV
jgi:hypothetical protein